MKRITVFADFDFLASPQEIGTLGYERVRGKAHFVFEYSHEWLKQHGGIVLSGDLMNVPSLQHPGAKTYQCLLIDQYSEQSDVTTLLQASGSYMLEEKEALEITKEVRAAIKDWRTTATELQISHKILEPYCSRWDNL